METDEKLRKIRHDFKSGIENLAAAISMNGAEDGKVVDQEDSQEVMRILDKMKDLWKKLEVYKETTKE